MSQFVSLAEAAEYLGVSKGTLRNWDKSGKLTATRNPANDYRQYDMDQLIKFKSQYVKSEEQIEHEEPIAQHHESDSKEIKSVIGRLHRILRDSYTTSDIMERFDEMSKLIFVSMMRNSSNPSFLNESLSDEERANIVKREYVKLITQTGIEAKGFDEIKLDSRTICECIDTLANFRLSNALADVKGLAYEEIIQGTFDKSDNQQFFTPREVVSFIANMMADKIYGTICDPACGTGGFLIEAARHNKDATYIGIEIDSRLSWITEMNMRLHGIDRGIIHHFESPGSLGSEASCMFGTVDIIMTNPPFGSDYTDKRVLSHFELGRRKKSRRRGILFLEQSFNLLKPGGILAIVIDQGVLNSASTTDVRRYLLDRFDFLAVVDLPDVTFMPYATVSTSILFLQKRNGVSKEAKKVFYAKADKVGRKSNGDIDYLYSDNGDVSLNSDLSTIISAWRNYCQTQEIEDGEICYVCDFDNEPFDNPSCRLDYAFHHPVRLQSIKDIEDASYPLIPLGEICTERNSTYLPASNLDCPTITMTGLANIEPYTGRYNRIPTVSASVKSAVKLYRPGDVVFAKMRPVLRKVFFAASEDEGFVSSECTVFTVRTDENMRPIIRPELLASILRSDFVFGQIMHLISGSGRPRVNNKDLRKILIPILPESLQVQLLAELSANAELAIKLRNNANSLIQEADQIERDGLSGLIEHAMKEKKYA